MAKSTAPVIYLFSDPPAPWTLESFSRALTAAHGFRVVLNQSEVKRPDLMLIDAEDDKPWPTDLPVSSYTTFMKQYPIEPVEEATTPAPAASATPKGLHRNGPWLSSLPIPPESVPYNPPGSTRTPFDAFLYAAGLIAIVFLIMLGKMLP